MAADYRFLLADLLTDEILAELPVEAASYAEVLNAPGTLSATIRLGFPQATEIPAVWINAGTSADKVGIVTATVTPDGTAITWSEPTAGAPDDYEVQYIEPGGSLTTAYTDATGLELSYVDEVRPAGTIWYVMATFTGPLEYTSDGVTPGETSQAPAPDVLPGEQAIYVERNGVLVWGGVVWTYLADVVTNQGSIGAEGFFSLLRGRTLETAFTKVATDQTTIMGDLIDDIQAYTEGDMLLDTSTITASGVTRDRSWLSTDWKDVGEAIEQLAAVDDGFDFRIGVAWGATIPERKVYTSYPATGRATSFVLELGRNLELLSLSIDATTLANKVYARGAEQADGTPLTTSVHNTGTGKVRRDQVITFDDVSSSATLIDHATRATDRGLAAVRIPFVAIYPEQEPTLGSFLVGDIVEVKGTFGAVDFGGDYRITGWKASISSAGNERVELTLAPLELFG